MNENQIFEAIGETDEEMLEKAENVQKKNTAWIKIVGAAAAVCVVAAGAAGIKALTDDIPTGDTVDNTTAAAGNAVPNEGMKEDMNSYSPETRAMLLSAAAYPVMPPYPNEFSEDFETQYDAWDNFIKEYRQEQNVEYKASINSFTYDSMSAFLTGAKNENRVVSPMNVYFALSMLAQSSEGNSRQQILDLLGAKDIDTLMSYSNSMWKRNFSDDGALTSIFANSVWLSENLGYNTDTINTLSESYFADIFSGNVSDPAYTKALQEWLSAKTGGMLEDEAKQIEMNSETVFSLASTVYFRGKWDSEFNPDKTAEDTFTTAMGEEITCDFMKKETEDFYYWSDNFGAINLRFSGAGSSRMWLILPDEGVTTDEILNSGEIEEFFAYFETMTPLGTHPNSKRIIINISMPKFDTAYSMDLTEGLTEMGITEVFDSEAADFSALLGTETANTALSAANHSVRVAVDEEGCIASAFTAMMAAGAAPPPDDQIDFFLNRPFIFIIQGVSGDPVFAGVINNPAN